MRRRKIAFAVSVSRLVKRHAGLRLFRGGRGEAWGVYVLGMQRGEAFTPGRFVWHELVTRDLSASQAFYEGMFGWQFEGSEAGYVQLLANGVVVGGMVHANGMRPATSWIPYVSVEDVDQTLQTAQAVGFSRVLGPSDMDAGRLCVVRDPEGAVLGLWHGAHGDPPEEIQAPALSSFCWDQLNTPDPQEEFEAYAYVLGWRRLQLTRAAQPELWTLLRGERQAGSLMKEAGEQAHWLSFVMVAQLEDARMRARALGGKVLVDCYEVPNVGAFSVLEDTLGAQIAAFAMTPS
jgi:predicted enzyme related to lactoylglutathione lyase